MPFSISASFYRRALYLRGPDLYAKLLKSFQLCLVCSAVCDQNIRLLRGKNVYKYILTDFFAVA